jgi:CheY-like chemotaxis protein
LSGTNTAGIIFYNVILHQKNMLALHERIDVIEITIPETEFDVTNTQFHKVISAYAIESRRVQTTDSALILKIHFRFMLYDWKKTVHAMLLNQHIPFEIASHFKTTINEFTPKKKVYIAEDDLHILFALNVMLEEAGYDVLLSHYGAPILNETLPLADIFILDNRMPDINGMEICRHLKSQASTRHIPVIMISAMENIKRRAKSAGVDEFLQKPFQMQDLLALVSKHTTTTLKGEYI